VTLLEFMTKLTLICIQVYGTPAVLVFFRERAFCTLLRWLKVCE